MNVTLFEVVSAALMALFSAVLAALWRKAETAEKQADQNRIAVEHLCKTLDKTADLNERMASLEASFGIEIKNLSLNIKRLESAVLRLYQDEHSRIANLPQK